MTPGSWVGEGNKSATFECMEGPFYIKSALFPIPDEWIVIIWEILNFNHGCLTLQMTNPVTLWYLELHFDYKFLLRYLKLVVLVCLDITYSSKCKFIYLKLAFKMLFFVVKTDKDF